MNLTNSLNAWSNRPELASFHADFIELAESVISARLHDRHLEDFDTYAISTGAGVFTLSANVIEVLGVRVGDEEVTFRPRDEVLAARSRGGPRVIACIVGRDIELSAMSGQAEVRQKIRISTIAGGGTNWIFQTFPNLYLFGCLVELFDHLRDEAQTAHYKTRFEEAIALANSTMTNKSTQQYARAKGAR